MKILAGLGNPGARYEFSRHNLGYRVVDHLCKAWNVALRKQRGARALVGRCKPFEEDVLLVKPLTFMNESGWAIREVLHQHKGSPKDLLVLVDDVAIGLGTLRIRSRGSDGGHNGLASVIAELGTAEFARVRLGIGTQAVAPEDLSGFVLGEFGAGEQRVVEALLRQAAQAVEVFLQHGIHKAMNRYNAKGKWMA